MQKFIIAVSLTLSLTACFPAGRGYGNNGYGNRGWDRFRHTVSHPMPGTNQVAEIR